MRYFPHLVIAALACFIVSCDRPDEPDSPTPGGPSQDTVNVPVTDSIESEASMSDSVYSALLPPVVFHGCFIEAAAAVSAHPYSVQVMAADPEIAVDSAVAEVSGPQVTWTVSDNGVCTYTLDYGTQPIIGVDGMEHSGRLYVIANAPFDQLGTTLTLVFDNFTAYGISVQGDMTIHNMGINNAQQPQYGISVANAHIGDGGYTYSENSVRTLIDGDPADFSTHTYSITGDFSNLNPESESYTIHISDNDPLLMSPADLYPTSGTVEVSVSPAIPIDLSSLGVPGTTLQLDHFTLNFTGRNENNQYGVSFTVTVVFMPVTISMLLDEQGVIEDSITVQYPNS